jgi:hypothetical protein
MNKSEKRLSNLDIDQSYQIITIESKIESVQIIWPVRSQFAALLYIRETQHCQNHKRSRIWNMQFIATFPKSLFEIHDDRTINAAT